MCKADYVTCGLLEIVGGTWKSWEICTREGLECYKQSLMSHCGRRVEDRDAECILL